MQLFGVLKIFKFIRGLNYRSILIIGIINFYSFNNPPVRFLIISLLVTLITQSNLLEEEGSYSTVTIFKIYLPLWTPPVKQIINLSAVRLTDGTELLSRWVEYAILVQMRVWFGMSGVWGWRSGGAEDR